MIHLAVHEYLESSISTSDGERLFLGKGHSFRRKSPKISMNAEHDSDASKDWWVPGAKSIPIGEGAEPCFSFEPKSSVRHLRYGRADAVRGVNLISEGHYRVEYRVNAAAHGDSGFGIILGVSDAEAAAWKEGAESVPPAGKPKPTKPTCAWGLCLSSGRLIETHDPHKGRFDGATVGEQLVERKKMGNPTVGMTVAIECEIPLHATRESSLVASRNYAAALHPLGVERNLPPHMQVLQERGVRNFIGSPIASPTWLAFSINGGEMIHTSVHLPSNGVYPWVLLSGEGDEVVCTDFKKLSADY